MSETTQSSLREVPEGYAQRTITVDGQPMTFTFYMGFASRVTHRPNGGSEIVVYEQEGVFHVPGGGSPEARTKMWISGGPDSLDVELEIDDGPMLPPSYRGPIQDFQVVTRKNGGGGQSARVRAVRGADKVASIHVTTRGGDGGVFPHMPGGGGSTDVTNAATTCPPTC